MPTEAVQEWLASPELIAELSSDTPFEGLRFALGRHGVTVDDDAATVLGTVLVAMVAASDSRLAQRLHQADLMRVLNEVNVGLGYIYEELLTQVLSVRRLLEPTQRRATALEQRLRESEALVQRRWSSLGVEAALAAALASDPSIGTSVQPDIDEVLLLTGTTGSGKSLCALRSYQVDLALAVLDEGSPIPVLLAAGDLVSRPVRGEVDAAAGDLGDPLNGVALVVDGLDEVAVSEARRILVETASLVASRPNSRAVLLSRPDVDHPGFPAQPIEVPDRDALEEVASRIVGRSHPFRALAPAVQAAVASPLYAVATAVLLARHEAVPQSKAAVVAKLVELCMRDADVTDEELLRSLAHDELTAGVVTQAAFGADRAARVAKSRLVHRTSGRVQFSVEVYREWFAAQWCLHHGLPAEVQSDNAAAAHRWLHPIALALTIGSEVESDALVAALLAHCPQLAGLVIRAATSSPAAGPSRSAAGPNAADRARTAVERTGEALRPVLAGVPANLVCRAETLASGEWLSIQPINDLGMTLGHASTKLNLSEPAWPWRIAHRELAKHLQLVLERELLPIDAEIVVAETAWAVARTVAGETGLLLDPLPADQAASALEGVAVEDPRLPVRLSRPPRHTIWMPNSLFELVRSRLRSLADAGSPVERPWPRPDNLGSSGGFVDNLYTAGTAESLQLELRRAALDLYESLVDAWFPSWRSFLPTASSMPVRIHYTFEPFSVQSRVASEYESWHPLPKLSPSIVEAAPRLEGRTLEDLLREWQEAGRPLPPFTRTFVSHHSIVHGLFSNRPATNLAYRWLLDDLRHLEWLESMPKYPGRD